MTETSFTDEEDALLETIQGEKKKSSVKDLTKKKLSKFELDEIFNST